MILCTKFHSSRLTTVHDIQDYASLIFWHMLYLHARNLHARSCLPASGQVLQVFFLALASSTGTSY